MDSLPNGTHTWGHLVKALLVLPVLLLLLLNNCLPLPQPQPIELNHAVEKRE